MKNFLIAFLLILCTVSLKSQWIKLQCPEGSISMNDNYIGYNIYTESNFNSPAASSTENWIYKTTDDWLSSNLILHVPGGDYGCCPIDNVFFIDDTIGFYEHHGQFGFTTIFRTLNEGELWKQIYSEYNPEYYIFDYFPISPNKLYCIAAEKTVPYSKAGVIFDITNNSFEKLYETDKYIFNYSNITFIKNDFGVMTVKDTGAYTSAIKMLITKDSGYSWLETRFVFPAYPYPNIRLSKNNAILTINMFNLIVRSVDYGNSWDTLYLPTDSLINDINFLDYYNGYLVSSQGEIFRTIDGGESWTSEESCTSEKLIKINIIDSNVVYITGENETLLKNNFAFTKIDIFNSKSNCKIYPNPIYDHFTIEIPDVCCNIQVKVFDVFGNKVASFSESICNLSNQSKGIYFINVKSENFSETHMIVKM